MSPLLSPYLQFLLLSWSLSLTYLNQIPHFVLVCDKIQPAYKWQLVCPWPGYAQLVRLPDLSIVGAIAFWKERRKENTIILRQVRKCAYCCLQLLIPL